MSTAAQIVSVEFIDAETGQAFARSDLPAGQLPESFAAETTLRLGGDPWLVERAEPPSAAEFVAAGRLTLTVRRLPEVSPEAILYSLPTICGTLPVVGQPPTPTARLELHEDDWRQVELVSHGRAVAVNAELDAIGQVYEQHGQRDAEGRIFAFGKIHIRFVATLAEPIPWQQLREFLPAPLHEYGGVGFGGSSGVALDSFALGLGPLTWYGINEHGSVSVLGLHLHAAAGPVAAASIEPIMRAFDLVLVDWCRGAVVGADDLPDYLQATGHGP